jgi:hypothetical protein
VRRFLKLQGRHAGAFPAIWRSGSGQERPCSAGLTCGGIGVCSIAPQDHRRGPVVSRRRRGCGMRGGGLFAKVPAENTLAATYVSFPTGMSVAGRVHAPHPRRKAADGCEDRQRQQRTSKTGRTGNPGRRNAACAKTSALAHWLLHTMCESKTFGSSPMCERSTTHSIVLKASSLSVRLAQYAKVAPR